ncbi:MAG: guanylate kinase [Nitrospiria bacterium]
MPKQIEDTQRKGILFVVSAPSGAGKTTLCGNVLKRMAHLQFSISHTTRKPRPGEKDGKDYFFVDEPTFRQGISEGAFLEWAEVHGHCYGTSKKQLEQWASQGVDVLLDIDTQGAMHLQKTLEGGIYIYILPPSFDILRERLIARGSDAPEEIAKRLQTAGEEIRYYHRYHYLIINEASEPATQNLEAIILAERLRLRLENRNWVEDRFIRLLSRKRNTITSSR